MASIIYQTDGKTFGQIVEDAVRMKVENIFVDGVTAAQAIGVSYSTFRRWCECKLIKGSGNPVKYPLAEMLFLNPDEIRSQYRMISKMS